MGLILRNCAQIPPPDAFDDGKNKMTLFLGPFFKQKFSQSVLFVLLLVLYLFLFVFLIIVVMDGIKEGREMDGRASVAFSSINVFTFINNVRLYH